METPSRVLSSRVARVIAAAVSSPRALIDRAPSGPNAISRSPDAVAKPATRVHDVASSSGDGSDPPRRFASSPRVVVVRVAAASRRNIATRPSARPHASTPEPRSNATHVSRRAATSGVDPAPDDGGRSA
eukprot:30991-Pelagococcus_subviridis.AAC.16